LRAGLAGVAGLSDGLSDGLSVGSLAGLLAGLSGGDGAAATLVPLPVSTGAGRLVVGADACRQVGASWPKIDTPCSPSTSSRAAWAGPLACGSGVAAAPRRLLRAGAGADADADAAGMTAAAGSSADNQSQPRPAPARRRRSRQAQASNWP
jgi:hypothetical protein